MSAEQFDVIIIGAGVSGIGAGVHLQQRCPGKSYVILEGRDAIGGTWDLFRYPGIRSDSDMHTFGYNFKPWKNPKAIADGPSIRAYVREAAEEHGVDRHIRFRHLVRRASWSSAECQWTVDAECDGQMRSFRARHLLMCAGYYRYSAGYTPDFPGVDRFRGQIVHPQHWPENLDYSGKRVVVIGSGATAVTLVPAMTDKAAHITMLQRSPTYMISRPAVDAVANWLRGHLPIKLAYTLTRWKNVLLQLLLFKFMRAFPDATKKHLMGLIGEQLGPAYDLETHFSPSYKPWDQRLCLVPDNDFFDVIREGKASVETGQVQSFTETGIRLESGRELDADLIVTATGLELQFAGGAELRVDGALVDIAKTVFYKGLMFSGIPNLVSVFGYTNASWTLRADLLAEFFCRLVNFMDEHGYTQVRPKLPDPAMPVKPFGNLTSGYFLRAADRIPKEGTVGPWRNPQNYAFDFFRFRFGSIEDEGLEFSRTEPAAAQADSREALAV